MITYLSLDLETTDIEPENGKIIEIAAIAFYVKDGKVHEVGRFDEVIGYEFLNGSPYALNMAAESGLLKDIIKKHPRIDNRATQSATTSSWHRFLRDQHDTAGGKLHPVGKNVSGFDIPWLKEHNFKTSEYLSHRCVDIGNLFFDPDIGPASLDTIAACEGLGEVKHRAMDDVKMCIDLFQIYMDRRGGNYRVVDGSECVVLPTAPDPLQPCSDDQGFDKIHLL